MAVDGSGNDLTWNGTIWSAATNFDGTNMVTSVSCRASNFCIAVDDAGNAFTYNGSWTQPKDIDGTRELTAVSCNSSGFCVAVDNHGNAVIRSGGNWALPQGIDGTTPLWGVSVVSSSFAVAVDEDGNALMYNGSSWSTTDIDGFEELQSASCTSTTFCAVVDVAGHAGFYSQSGTQQLIWDTAASEPLVLSDGTNYYVYGATGEPVEQVNVTASPPSSNPVFLTYTQSDSSWLATNTSGNELAFWRYDAFGTVALGTPDSPFGYAGQFADTSSRVPSGFGNMRARWYQAQTGQFTSVDPDFGQSDQAYGYTGDDPVNGIDPTGLLFVGPGGGGGSTNNLPVKTVAERELYIWTYFRSKGLTMIQTAGILGNLLSEDNKLSPTFSQFGGPGYGLAQWTRGDNGVYDSWNDLVNCAGSVTKAKTFRFQVAYIWDELSDSSLRYYVPNVSKISAFLSVQDSSIEDATSDFEAAIEGAGAVKIWVRKCYADSVYESQGQSFQASCWNVRQP
jgi:RHS repeat-associated protein